MAELAGQVGKMVEHPKKVLAQPRSTTNWDALYNPMQSVTTLVGIRKFAVQVVMGELLV